MKFTSGNRPRFETEQELAELFDRDLEPGARFTDVVRKHLPGCGLREFVASVTAQQALGAYELQVCELVPYVGPKGTTGGIIIFPTGMIRTEVVARTVVEVAGLPGGTRVAARVTPQDEVKANVAAVARGAAPAQPQIAGAVAAYAQFAEPRTTVTGTNPTYRYLRVAGWPSDLHYEFLHRVTRNEFGAELHFESDEEEVQRAARAIRDSKIRLAPQFPKPVWHEPWQVVGGRLRVLFTSDTDPDIVARAMVSLIRVTRGIVDEALRS